MAMYHMTAKTISRSRGQSAVASAAYRSGEKLRDMGLDKDFEYSNKEGVVHTEILTPEKAPEWAKDREKLWNEVEKSEKRKDSQVAREVEIALPCELSREEQIECARDFVKENFVNQGMVADMCIHEKEFTTIDDDGNEVSRTGCHAHIMLTTRTIDENGFGKKERSWNDKKLLEQWRENWAKTANRHLERAGFEVRIDHRSYKDRGIDIEPQKKIGGVGPDIAAERMAEHEQIARENGERIIKDPSIATDHLTYHESTFSRADIYKLAHRNSADPEQFDRVANSIFESPDLVNLGRGDDGKERFTRRCCP